MRIVEKKVCNERTTTNVEERMGTMNIKLIKEQEECITILDTRGVITSREDIIRRWMLQSNQKSYK